MHDDDEEPEIANIVFLLRHVPELSGTVDDLIALLDDAPPLQLLCEALADLLNDKAANGADRDDLYVRAARFVDGMTDRYGSSISHELSGSLAAHLRKEPRRRLAASCTGPTRSILDRQAPPPPPPASP